MKNGLKILILILLVITPEKYLYSQTGFDSYRFWNQGPVNGEISLRGIYRDQTTLLRDLEENQQSRYLMGGIRVNTSAWLWKPDILNFYVGGEFNPETRNEKYLIVPDRAEARTLSKLDMRATLFNNRVVNLNSYLNLSQSYFKREYLTNIRSDNRQWGGLLGFSNKFLPASFSYRNTSWKQNEIQTGRHFEMEQNNLEGRITKSFSSYDRSEIRLSLDDYSYKYDLLDSNSNQVKRMSFINSVWFDEKHNYSFNSNVMYHDQAGTYDFTRLEIAERLNFILPASFRFSSGYNYMKLSDIYQDTESHRAQAGINHKLFESLYSSLFTELSYVNHTLYEERDLKAGFEIRYTKKIGSSKINIGYKYFRHNSDMTSAPSLVRIVNEQHTLTDGSVTILNKPYIESGSVIIRDITGTIIYQENLDYLLSGIGDYIEVIRVPGGQIADGDNIMAEYTATQPGSYTFRANNNSLSLSLSMFKNLFEIYYRGTAQEYPFLVDTEFLVLSSYYQNIYGARFNTSFANGGIEYDNYNSNIIPYRRLRYFVSSNIIIKTRFIISVNANINDYKMLNEDVNLLYASINGRLAYNFSPAMRASMEAGYLTQTGRNIDLDLFTTRAEVSYTRRLLQLKAGVEMYRRHYLESDIYFAGSYIQLSRKF